MLFLATGCASTGATGGTSGAADPAGEGSLIVILNSNPSGSAVTAFIVPDGGGPEPLGTIDRGRQGEFAFDGPPGIYRLRLIGGQGEQLSDTFRYYRNSVVRWDAGSSARVRVSGN